MRGEKLLSHKIPLRDHFIVAISVTLARGLTNVSMQLLNYPTLVRFFSPLFSVRPSKPHLNFIVH
jgi:hypothetical protein